MGNTEFEKKVMEHLREVRKLYAEHVRSAMPAAGCPFINVSVTEDAFGFECGDLLIDMSIQSTASGWEYESKEGDISNG